MSFLWVGVQTFWRSRDPFLLKNQDPTFDFSAESSLLSFFFDKDHLQKIKVHFLLIKKNQP